MTTDSVKQKMDDLNKMGAKAREASQNLSKLLTPVKNKALTNIAEGLKARQEDILAANERDLETGRNNGLSEALLDRLLLDPERLEGLASDVRNVAALPDPVGEELDSRVLPNGLKVGRRRVPLGVIGAIYESRPNITADIAALCIKSGNAAILRGGSESINTNTAMAEMIRDGIAEAGVTRDAVQLVKSTDRDLVGQMLEMKVYIDLIIPRGGADLIRRVAAEATMPAITGGIGVCHTYVDRDANLDMAVDITHNAKTSRPSVCNALDSVLVHSEIARDYLPSLATRWAEAGVEMRCDRRALSIVGRVDGLSIVPATDEDWGAEYLSMTAAVKVVDSIDEALAHIAAYGSGHTEAIVTEDYSAANRFLDDVDSGVVMVNASTRFNDGSQLGLGAEVAISTNKMHARGPMGLRELTSYKWTVMGSGQVRK